MPASWQSGGHNAAMRASSITRRPSLTLACLCAATLGLAACSATSGSGSGSGTAASAAPTTAAGPSTYASIAELQKALEGKGITCKLEYPGLKDDTAQTELSICVIDGEQAFLKVWLKPEQIKEFLASPDGETGTVAVGANWTITVTSNAVADKVAKAIGGTAPAGTAAPGGTTATR